MRRLSIIAGLLLWASASVAQPYPSPTFQTETLISPPTWQGQTGYPYANGSSPATFSPTIPGSALTGALSASVLGTSNIWTAPQTLNLPPGLDQGLHIGQQSSGVAGSGQTCPVGTADTFYFMNCIQSSNWNVNAAGNLVATFGVRTQINGISAQAGNGMFGFISDVEWYQDAGNPSAGQNSYTALVGLTRVFANPTETNGVVFEGGNANVALAGGVALPANSSLVGAESDFTSNDSGNALAASNTRRAGWQFTNVSADRASGYQDAGLLFNTNTLGGAIVPLGVKYGWLLDNALSATIASTGTLIGTNGAGTIANGVDLSGWTVSGCALKLAYGCIADGAGDLTAKNLGVGIAAPTGVLAQFHTTTDSNFTISSGVVPTLSSINDAFNVLGVMNIQASTLVVTAVIQNAASTGTPAASLCLDASNNIIKKTTSGSCI
jgi:hypothetical protein